MLFSKILIGILFGYVGISILVSFIILLLMSEFLISIKEAFSIGFAWPFILYEEIKNRLR